MSATTDPPVVFAKLGWMNKYNGPQPGDLKPIGGGAHTRHGFGHEGFNFRIFGGRWFGFVRLVKGELALHRISPDAVGRSVKGAIVIFIASDPGPRGGQWIVGWYGNATVYRHARDYEPAIERKILSAVRPQDAKFRCFGYSFECKPSDAVLLPYPQRRFRIPAGKGAFGEYLVCYALEENGAPKAGSWISEAVDYVRSYDKDNLLLQDCGDQETEDAVNVALERAAGFQSNAHIRRAVEDYAMECAKRYLQQKKYSKILSTADRHCYDYTCVDSKKTVYVEVKGTQTNGKTITITKNEKAHLERNLRNCILYVRHSVEVKGRRKVKVSGGVEKVFDRWNAKSGSFAPATYTYTLPNN